MKNCTSILVADDEPDLRNICRDALETSGYNIFEASDGKEALQLLQEQDIDLVLSDIRMPKMDGIQLLNKIVQQKLDVDFIIITGFGSIETAVDTIKKGALDYLPKPFQVDHLLLKVEKALSHRRERHEKKNLNNLVNFLRLSQDLNNHLELSTLLNEFIFHLERNFSPSSAGIFLKEDTSEELQMVRVRGRMLRSDPMMLKKVRKLCKEVMEKQVFKLVDPYVIQTDKELRQWLGDEEVNFSMLLSPIVKQNTSSGVVVLIRDSSKPFYTNDDLQMLKVFTSQTASAIDNARLYGQLQEMNQEIIRSLAQAVEAKDIYTRGHSDQVASYATKLGRKLKLSSEEINQLYLAGIVHDIGKIGIPDQILNKPGSLTEKEFSIMKGHPEVGKNILLQVGSLQHILPIIYHHHENVNGTGYPSGIKDSQIPFLAKVMSVVDAFDAMTSDRAYRNAMSVSEVWEIMQNKAGLQWDKELVEQWMQVINNGNQKT